MKLAFVLQEAQDYSKLTSTNSRNLAFAGIAVVWILSSKSPEAVINQVALWFFCLALCFDLVHYTIGYVLWERFSLSKQDELFTKYEKDSDMITKIENHDFTAPSWINKPTRILFVLKPCLVILGYIFLLFSMINLG